MIKSKLGVITTSVTVRGRCLLIYIYILVNRRRHTLCASCTTAHALALALQAACKLCVAVRRANSQLKHAVNMTSNAIPALPRTLAFC